MSFLEFEEYSNPLRRGGYSLGGYAMGGAGKQGAHRVGEKLSAAQKAKMAQGRAETAALRAQLKASGLTKEEIKQELHQVKLEKARARSGARPRASSGARPRARKSTMLALPSSEHVEMANLPVKHVKPPTRRHKAIKYPEYEVNEPYNPSFNLLKRINRIKPTAENAKLRHQISNLLEAQGYGDDMEAMEMMAGGARRRRVGRPRKAQAKRKAPAKKKASMTMHRGGYYEAMPDEYKMMAGGASRRRVGRPRKAQAMHPRMRGGFGWGDVWDIAKKVAPLGLALL